MWLHSGVVGVVCLGCVWGCGCGSIWGGVFGCCWGVGWGCGGCFCFLGCFSFFVSGSLRFCGVGVGGWMMWFGVLNSLVPAQMSAIAVIAPT